MEEGRSDEIYLWLKVFDGADFPCARVWKGKKLDCLLNQGCVCSKMWRELEFVYKIKVFPKSRFTKLRFGCTFFSKQTLYYSTRYCRIDWTHKGTWWKDDIKMSIQRISATCQGIVRPCHSKMVEFFGPVLRQLQANYVNSRMNEEIYLVFD